MQKIVSAAYTALASGASPHTSCPKLIEALHGDAVLRLQSAAQRLLVRSTLGVLPDCRAFLGECHQDVTHTYRIEQECKANAASKAAAKSIRLVRACIRAWISAFKRFAKLQCLPHLKLVIRAKDRKGNYDVFLEEKEAKSGSVLEQYLECGEYLNVPSSATMKLYEEHQVSAEEAGQVTDEDTAMVAAAHPAPPDEALARHVEAAGVFLALADDAPVSLALSNSDERDVEQNACLAADSTAVHRESNGQTGQVAVDCGEGGEPAEMAVPAPAIPEQPKKTQNSATAAQDDIGQAEEPTRKINAFLPLEGAQSLHADAECHRQTPPKRRIRAIRPRPEPHQAGMPRAIPNAFAGADAMPSAEVFGLPVAIRPPLSPGLIPLS